MEKRTVGMIATGVAVLLCGCPGLFAMFFGSIFAFAGAMPGATINNFDGSSDPTTAVLTGLGTCCFGLFFLIIPIAVGFFTLRNKVTEPAAGGEPLSYG